VYPFERFTEANKRVPTLVQEEAERAHQSYLVALVVGSAAVGLEHTWNPSTTPPSSSTSRGRPAHGDCLNDSPETKYVRTSDGIYIAYQVVGEGPADFVFDFNPDESNVDLMWAEPDWEPFLTGTTAFGRVIVHDRRGLGVSSRNVPPANLEDAGRRPAGRARLRRLHATDPDRWLGHRGNARALRGDPSGPAVWAPVEQPHGPHRVGAGLSLGTGSGGVRAFDAARGHVGDSGIQPCHRGVSSGRAYRHARVARTPFGHRSTTAE